MSTLKEESKNTSIKPQSLFEKEVLEGLSATQKYLSSKFIYDQKGDRLFQEIMAMPGYYLTRSEFELFEKHKTEIITSFDPEKSGFDLIELGAGDGKKTKVLLKELIRASSDFTYQPVDISSNALEMLSRSLKSELPGVEVILKQGEYFEILTALKSESIRRRVIMFLGSNIGNLLHPRAIEFLTGLRKIMKPNDLLFIGFDQKKDPQVILDAYNDKEGITAAFNLNLLERINRELGGTFDLTAFKHWEVYNPETGTAKSYLVSKKKQEVAVKGLNRVFQFEAWESIHTEISQKYDDSTVSWLAAESGLEIIKSYADDNSYYKNYLLQVL